MDPKTIARYAFRETMGLVIMGVTLFWPAGTINWWQAWAVLAATLVWILATALVILRLHPALLAERLGPRRGAFGWDTLLLGILGLTQLGRYLLAGFDHRLGWSGAFALPVQVLALLVCILGYTLFVWATAANAYFSQVVRIQTERGHEVATTGPYRYVRHPAYAGAILYEVAVAFLLGSWPVLAVGIFNVLLLILRTALEDRTLRARLPGYLEYTQRTKYRIVPKIW